MLFTRRRVTLALAAFALGSVVSTAGAQQSYPQSLYWGAGLIDIPVAWVSPLSGDFALNYSGKSFKKDESLPKINYSGRINSQLTLSVSLFGRAEIGVAAYSSNPEGGAFGQLLALNEEDFRNTPGLSRFIPSVAFGVRNVGSFDKIDRFGVGYTLVPPASGSTDPNYQHVPDSLHQNFSTANTVFGVATKSFSLADFRRTFPDVNVSLSLGYGNGLFKDKGGLGAAYSSHATGGMFGGVKVDMTPAPNTLLSLMVENNAWDYNIGASLDYRGIRAGLYLTEIGGSSVTTSQRPDLVYGYSKVAFTVGWQSNIFALLRGDILRNRVAQLERQRATLLAQIEERQQRIASLTQEIQRYEAQNLLELEARRAAVEEELRREREALKRLEDRLNIIERTTPPPKPPQR
ncbi:MAG: OmpH family outer membrane protein [Gemmatimonadaceae bacterium]